MTAQASSVPGSPMDAPAVAARPIAASRLLYWSLRRELWEYRSVYLAPLAMAGAVIFGYLFHLAHLSALMRQAMTLAPEPQRELLGQPYAVASGLIMSAAAVVSIFYSLDALYGERRDRSILFWKSLPVPDLTTVLAKACVALLALPAIAFAITVAALAIMMLLSTVVMLASGLSVATYWSILQPFESLFGLLYHLVTVHILWYAPLYAWLLLISAWARRAPFLWAVMPPLAVVIFEKVAFRTAHFQDFLMNRVSGGTEATNQMQGNVMDPAQHFTPGHFLATPGLWAGLIFAAIFLYAAARMRRYRGPI